MKSKSIALLFLCISFVSISCDAPIKEQSEKNMDSLNLIEKSKEFIRAFEARDVETMKSNWAEGETFYRMPYASGMFPGNFKGKDEFHDFAKDLPEMLEDVKLDIVEIILDEKARKVVARTEIKIEVKGADQYENAQIFFFRFNEEGKFLEVSEYYNPVPTAIGLKKFGAHDRLLDSLKVN